MNISVRANLLWNGHPSCGMGIHLVEWASLPVLHQGGIGTTAQALQAGRPTLIVPYSHDQPDNAARVERLGTSRTINRNQYLAPKVVKLRELLNPNYAIKAAEIADIIQAENGVSIACDAIKKQLKFV